jgi:hypothetical protein
MKKLLPVVVFAIMSVVGVAYSIDDDARFSSTGTADEVGLWCRGQDSTKTDFSMKQGLYYNCVTGEVSVGQGLGKDSLDTGAVTSIKIGSAAVLTSKLGGAGATQATGPILCAVGASGIGYCTQAIDTGKTCECIPYPTES